MVSDILKMLTDVDVGQCPYLDGQRETIRAIRCPGLPNVLHAELMERGFRHSRDLFYIPNCRDCCRCIPMRIDPLKFAPSKKQRHIFNKCADFEIRIGAPQADDEKYDIYRRYMIYQHSGSMQGSSREALDSLYSCLPSSVEIQYRRGIQIVGITLADLIPGRALSSVYHFFDPDYAKYSVGVFSMLAEIKLAELMEIPYFYLGLWVPGSPKMQYKARYRPNQIYVNGEWIDHDCEEA